MAGTHHAILLVDDNEDTLEMYALGLSFAGYRPLTATDANGALGQVKLERPEAIVTDLQFARGLDGWELIREIKNDPDARQIPIVVLTGRIDSSVEAKAQRIGCVAVLVKPCLPDELAKVLQQVLPHDKAVA